MGVRRLLWRFYSSERKIRILRQQGCSIGANCQLIGNVDFGSEPYLVSVGNHVRFSDGACITTHDGGVWVLRYLDSALCDVDKFAPVVIGDNVHVGMGAVIMPGVTIGSNVVIGARAVVTRDIPDNSIAVGVPARVIESVDDYREKALPKLVHTKELSYKEKQYYLLNSSTKNE